MFFAHSSWTLNVSNNQQTGCWYSRYRGVKVQPFYFADLLSWWCKMKHEKSPLLFLRLNVMSVRLEMSLKPKNNEVKSPKLVGFNLRTQMPSADLAINLNLSLNFLLNEEKSWLYIVMKQFCPISLKQRFSHSFAISHEWSWAATFHTN